MAHPSPTSTAAIRAAARTQDTEWLKQAVSFAGRAGAIGWQSEDGQIHDTGARCIAIVRAELIRRGEKGVR